MSVNEKSKPRIKQLKLEMDKIVEGDFDSLKVREQLTKKVGESKTQLIFKEFQHSSDKSYHNLVQITSNALNDDNSSIPLKDKAILAFTNEHRRFKKGSTQENSDKTICMSPISKLSDKVGKFLSDDISSEDFYRALLKNNIDPESKQVKKIMSELEMESNKSHNKAMSSLLRVKDIHPKEEEDLESKVIKSPMKQTMTSFQDSSFKADLEITYSKKKKLETAQKPINIFEQENRKKDQISNSFALSSDASSQSVSTLHQKKIDFMSQSSVFKKQPPEPLAQEKLENKYYNSVLQNFSSKSTFSHKTRIDAITSPRARSGIKNKNVVSEENIAAVAHKPLKEDAQIKIVGMYGKAKNQNTINDVNQNRSSYSEIFGGGPQKKEVKPQPAQTINEPEPKVIKESPKPKAVTTTFQKLAPKPSVEDSKGSLEASSGFKSLASRKQ